MTIAGTRVARDAADVLILDDNFASCVKTLWWGRNVYDGICSYLQGQLCLSLTAGVFSVACMFYYNQPPLPVTQILWVNVVLQSVGTYAFACEKPQLSQLNRAPKRREEGLISQNMWITVIGQTIYQSAVLCIILFAGAGDPCPAYIANCEKTLYPGGFLDIPSGMRLGMVQTGGGGHSVDTQVPPNEHHTVLFTTWVFMTVFNWFNCRKMYTELNVFSNITQNLRFFGVVAACIVAQVLIVQVPVIAEDGRNPIWLTKYMPGYLWIISVACGLMVIPVNIFAQLFGKLILPENKGKRVDFTRGADKKNRKRVSVSEEEAKSLKEGIEMSF
eukprot:gnl/TRDRNA2_/TRDRNA2_116749_c4_seq1.p1 gnl/TRDRNA2_/TRDRNA2_116749_c4~~gnl/TRDRNA2_/TRDRNA2_116749_c4_seq1.p1  ORF type:complete len:331 (+),score=52.04 gnl/TRDRNA2_/TRDRNA2_116749_c4_seq1:462-1454(+)